MEIDFIELMRSKSDEGLQEYVDNRLKYTSKAVLAAIDELKNRGKNIHDSELELIKKDLTKKEEEGKQRTTNSEFRLFNRNKIVLPAITAISKRQKYFLLIFMILCAIIRVANPGWVLIVGFYIIIPYYFLHFWGQLTTFKRADLKRIDFLCIYSSTFLLLMATLVQQDFTDNRCFYLLDDISRSFLPPPDETPFSLSTIIVFSVDTIINLYLIIKANFKN